MTGSLARCSPMLLFAALLAGCAAVSELNLVSTEQEVAMGAEFSAEVEREMKMLDDPVVEAYIDSLGQILARNSDRTDIAYRFRVVDTDEVNAFALPGGFLYVNRGLITTAENESELAGVIAHEVGHVVGRHSAKMLTRQYGIAMIAQIALGEDPGLVKSLVANIAATGALMKYSRDAEREADRFGVDEAHRSGIDPNGMATFFEKLQTMHERKPSSIEKFFSTHPPTAERISDTRSYIASLPALASPTRDSERFRRVQERIRARSGS
ncbi:MAG: M48 family metalloprotease [Candidatus Eisenbacteria bacterium]|nr:M48 family metalloprotease [Candidatus Eisenbacteria bacterium]